VLLEPDWLQELLFPKHEPGGLIGYGALACVPKFTFEKIFSLGSRDVLNWKLFWDQISENGSDELVCFTLFDVHEVFVYKVDSEIV